MCDKVLLVANFCLWCSSLAVKKRRKKGSKKNKSSSFCSSFVQPTPSVMKILHLSDLHVDLLYDEGSSVVCEHPYCCRHAFGDPGPGEEAAGHWGSLGYCDIPEHTLADLLSQAATITTPDLVWVTVLEGWGECGLRCSSWGYVVRVGVRRLCCIWVFLSVFQE